MFSTLALYADALEGSLLHQKLTPLMNDLQGVIDSHGLGDEILVIARKVA